MVWHRAADQSVTDSVMFQFTDAYERNLVINKYDFRGQNIDLEKDKHHFHQGTSGL